MRKFGNREFFKETLRLGLPVAIQGLLTSSLSFIDTLMVGSQGENALAAVGAAGQFGGLLFGFYWGLCCGGTLFIAQYHGIHDEDGIRPYKYLYDGAGSDIFRAGDIHTG